MTIWSLENQFPFQVKPIGEPSGLYWNNAGRRFSRLNVVLDLYYEDLNLNELGRVEIYRTDLVTKRLDTHAFNKTDGHTHFNTAVFLHFFNRCSDGILFWPQ